MHFLVPTNMAVPENYARLFRNLAHMVALSQEGKTNAVVENLVVTVLTLDSALHAKKPADVVAAIELYFGLKFLDKDLQSAIDRLLTASRVLRTPAGELVPSVEARADVNSRVTDAQALETEVRREWLDSLRDYQSQRNPSKDEQLWACLRSYMAKAFERHGAQTTLLLNPDESLSIELDKSLGSYMKEAIAKSCLSVPAPIAQNAIRDFFIDSTPLRSRYIAQLLDGTFSFYAVCVDEVTSAYLRTAIQPVSIFLDTNFVFGLLKLHENPLNEVSEELVAAIQTNQFPFKLYYHERTLDEFYSALSHIRERLISYKWTTELSRAAVRTRSLGLIEHRYHEANSVRPTDPRVFLTKYEHVEQILLDKGFTIYREPQRSPLILEALDKEQTLLYAKYNAFLVNRLGLDRTKSYKTIEHDVVVWQTVKGLRRQGTTALDIGALLLTADANLYAFDWQKLRPKGATGHVILPNQLLQLLRPFLVVTADFDKKFAATFAIPEFRTIATGYSATASKVLGYLTTLADVTEETASRILANEVLLGKLRNVPTDAPQFKRSVDSTLARDNNDLIKQNEELLAKLSTAEKSRAHVSSALQEKDALLERQRRLLKEQRGITKLRKSEAKRNRQQAELERTAKAQQQAEAADLRSKLKRVETRGREQQQDLAQVRREHARFLRRLRRGIAFGLYVIGICVGVYLEMHWDWLRHHSKRLGLSISVFVLLTSICWAIADSRRNRRRLALLTIAIGAVFTLAQVADSDASKSEVREKSGQ
jgi:hypothetical protein